MLWAQAAVMPVSCPTVQHQNIDMQSPFQLQLPSSPAGPSSPMGVQIFTAVRALYQDPDNPHHRDLYLSHTSAVFKNALSFAPARLTPAHVTDDDSDDGLLPGPKRPKGMAQLPLPGATRHQAQLLVHSMYCYKRESWADTLSPPELIDLATISDKFCCVSVLQLADEALVRKTASKSDTGWLNVLDAPGKLQLARRLRLTSYEAHVGRFLGRHARKVDLTRLDASTAAILEGAR